MKLRTHQFGGSLEEIEEREINKMKRFVNKNCYNEVCFGSERFEDKKDYERVRKEFTAQCEKDGRLLAPIHDWQAPNGVHIGDQIYFVDDDPDRTETRIFPTEEQLKG